MGQIAKALGLGSEFEFQGQTYRLSPWSFKIQSEFELYLEGQAVKAVHRMRPHLSDEEYREQLDSVRRDIVRGEYTFGSESVAKAYTATPHMKYLLFLMLRDNHPDIKKDLVDQIVEERFEEAIAAMALANADPTTSPAAPTPAPGTTPLPGS